MMSATHALARLADLVEVTTDRDVLEAHRHDQAAPGLLAAGTPAALLRPRNTDQVAAAIRLAHETGTPVVPRGAGSGLSGGANAVDGCWILALDRMTGASINPEGPVAVVRPGTINDHLRAQATAVGLQYPPDPASAAMCTIGGNIATNAGGLCCVRYGVTRDYVLGIEFVAPNGQPHRVGGASRKNVVGYDLVSLLCGSEGTLGVITEATLRLVPNVSGASTAVAVFPRLVDAGRAVTRIMGRFVPSMLELIDRSSINAVEDVQPMELDRNAEAMLFARAEEGRQVIEAIAEICESTGADFAVTSDDEAEGRMLVAARRLVYPALERRGATLLDDVGVPLPRMPELLEGIQAIAEQHRVLIATFGHAGDGNMHPTIIFDHHNLDERERASRAFRAIVELALRLDGTATGEHGVGALKRDFVAHQLGPAYSLNRAIKDAFDPKGIMNPSKSL